MSVGGGRGEDGRLRESRERRDVKVFEPGIGRQNKLMRVLQKVADLVAFSGPGPSSPVCQDFPS